MPSPDPDKPCLEQPCDEPRSAGNARCHEHQRLFIKVKENRKRARDGEEALAASKREAAKAVIEAAGGAVVELGQFGQVLPGRIRAAANHVEQVDLLSEWVASASPDAAQRFGAQLEIAKNLASLVDDDGGLDQKVLNNYRVAVKDIVERVDKVYGAEQIDILAGIRRIIEDRGKELEAEGWRARVS